MPKTTNWLSRATAKAQVSTFTIAGTIAAADTFTLTINGKSVTYTATGAGTAAVASGLQALAAAMAYTDWTSITWTVSGSVVTATGVNVGVNHTITESKSSALGTITQATSTAATGPNAFDNSANWDNGVPANGDTVNIDLARGSILTGLTAYSGVTVDLLRIFSTSATQNVIGLADLNSAGYTEYRTKYLTMSAAACEVDCESTRINLDFGAIANTTRVLRCGSAGIGGVPALRIKGNEPNSVIYLYAGFLGVAYGDDETYEGDTVEASGTTARLHVGQGATITNVYVNSATLKTAPDATLNYMNVTGGTADIGTFTGTLLVFDGGANVTLGGASSSFVLLVYRATVTVTDWIEPSAIELGVGAVIRNPFNKIGWSGTFTPAGGNLSLTAS